MTPFAGVSLGSLLDAALVVVSVLAVPVGPLPVQPAVSMRANKAVTAKERELTVMHLRHTAAGSGSHLSSFAERTHL
jgi:hypothetical protein